MTTCKDCKFYKELEPLETGVIGECRRNPPHADLSFPMVDDDDWCGEFAPIESEAAPAFDAAEVGQLISNLMGSVYYKATISDWLTESQKRAAEIVENDKRDLLAALGIDK